MGYLVDPGQIEAASRLLGETVSEEALLTQLEELQATFHRLNMSGGAHPDLSSTIRRAYAIATIAASRHSNADDSESEKGLGLAALIFEYLGRLSGDPFERFQLLTNAVLFYSRGNQEAQSATLARRIGNDRLIREWAEVDEDALPWSIVLEFLGRDLQSLLRWERGNISEFLHQLESENENADFWRALVSGCLSVAKSLVWGSAADPAEFAAAIATARQIGSSRLVWLAITLREIGEAMVQHSLFSISRRLGLPDWAPQAITMDSYFELWESHRGAFSAKENMPLGVLSDNAAVSLVNMPTSSGKSLIAEMVLLSVLVRNPGSRAIWIVPSRALVFEVESRLRRHLRRIGISVSSLPGGIEPNPDDDDEMQTSRVLVLTPEKLDGLLRRGHGSLDQVGVVVVDEVHKVGQHGRGLLLEGIIAWLLTIAESNPSLKLLFMSAVLPNREDFEVWLGGESNRFTPVSSSWRPTRLATFFTRPSTGHWYTYLVESHGVVPVALHQDIVRPEDFEVPLHLLGWLNRRRAGRTTLVFFYTKDEVNAFVSRVAAEWNEQTEVPEEVRHTWRALAAKFATVYGEDHDFCLAIRRGVALDHGDIPMWLRRAVEEAFRDGQIPVLVANQTVLEGVNFPIQDLILASLGSRSGRNFTFRVGMQDFANLLGRVGRATVDTEGRCFVVWNWFYRNATQDALSWDQYVSPFPNLGAVHSSLLSSPDELERALSRLTEALLAGNDDPFAGLGEWRERLERLYSFALAVLEQGESLSYERLVAWLQRTYAWIQSGEELRARLGMFCRAAISSVEHTDTRSYRVASLSGLTVRSARILIDIAETLVVRNGAGQLTGLADLIPEGDYARLIGLRECWGGPQAPVTYGTRRYRPRLDHYRALAAWVTGGSWERLRAVICENHQNLLPKTQIGIVTSYVSQMFEYRLPWIIGGLVVAVREVAPQERELIRRLEETPQLVRYGVPSMDEVAACRLGVEREQAMTLCAAFREAGAHGRIGDWLREVPEERLHELFPNEPASFVRALLNRLHALRSRDWLLRRDGFVFTPLEEHRDCDWDAIGTRNLKGCRLVVDFWREGSAEVAVVANVQGQDCVVGFVPSRHLEEVTELLDWGRTIHAETFLAPSGLLALLQLAEA